MKKSFLFIILFILFPNLLFAFLAKVNDEVIEVDDFKNALSDFHLLMQMRGRTTAGKLNLDILENALQRMIENYLIAQEAKRLGFSDAQVAKCWGVGEEDVRALRKSLKIIPVVKQIDTLAAEWPATTNYLYVTYGGDDDDIALDNKRKKVIVLGSGTYRIGSSVEFDWCSVNTVWALKRQGVDEVIIINYNPETVSTDYDVTDKLYFEELTFERVLDIIEKEKPLGVVLSVGGQIPNNLALKLAKTGVSILGTSAESIDKAEDRAKFSKLLDDLGIPQPPWSKFTSIKDAEDFARKIGYPVLVRPSSVSYTHLTLPTTERV